MTLKSLPGMIETILSYKCYKCYKCSLNNTKLFTSDMIYETLENL
jgi:hypothetical protein